MTAIIHVWQPMDIMVVLKVVGSLLPGPISREGVRFYGGVRVRKQ